MLKLAALLSLSIGSILVLAPQTPELRVGRGEFRKPISHLPFVIDECGSYFLTKCLTGASGQDGITIQADDVTIDLNGFALSGVPGSLNGIHVPGTQENLALRNGVVRSWGQTGVNLAGADHSTVEDIRSQGNGDEGIRVRESCFVSKCIANTNAANGITANGQGTTVMDCVAHANGGIGIKLLSQGLVADCTARENGSHGIESNSSSVMRSCVANDNQGIGLNVGDTCVAEDCVATSNGSHGIQTNDRAIVRRCTSGSNTRTGIRVQHNCYVADCIATNNTEWGVYVNGNETRVESNHLLENVLGAVRMTGSCGNLLVRNSAGNANPTCGPNDLNALYSVDGDDNVGTRLEKPGLDFSADPWANFGL